MTKILIYSPTPIGKIMTGPAIRASEFAKALSPQHQVALLSPETAQNLDVHFKEADILITQTLPLNIALKAIKHRTKIIIDAYDPTFLELLEFFKDKPMDVRQEKTFSAITNLNFNIKMADGILCASERQRDLWLGFLSSHKLVSPALYDRDNSLRQFIDVVPFGLSSTPPQKNGPGIRESYGFSHSDKVVLWGGGIWNWFDPLTLIKAIKILSQQRSDIKLVFMGVKPPDPELAAMSMSAKAIALAHELGLNKKHVFFHHDWVPYENRQNMLLDADIGVSTHFDHLETQFSFRTRMLDYIWTQLPIIATEGDSFAELIQKHDLGLTVPYQNEQALADAIAKLADNADDKNRIKNNLRAISQNFEWNEVVKPLQNMISRLNAQKQPRSRWCSYKNLGVSLLTKVKEKGLKASLKKLF